MKLINYFRFIISPVNGEQYINTKKIGDNELIINTSIEEAIDVQRLGVVRSLPMNYKGDVEVGNVVVVHHNTFRITYNAHGIPYQSENHIKDDLFYVSPDCVYMVIKDKEKIATDDNCFIKPIVKKDFWHGEKELERIGIVKYPSKKMINDGVVAGTKISFRKFCEYEFNINNEKLYNMKDYRVLSKIN